MGGVREDTGGSRRMYEREWKSKFPGTTVIHLFGNIEHPLEV